MWTLVLTCAGLKLGSPANCTVRGIVPGAGADAILTVATPLASVVACKVWPLNIKLRARPLSGLPVLSVNCAARTSGSLNSPLLCPAYNSTGVPAAGGSTGGGHGPAAVQVLVTCCDWNEPPAALVTDACRMSVPGNVLV